MRLRFDFLPVNCLPLCLMHYASMHTEVSAATIVARMQFKLLFEAEFLSSLEA